MPRGRTSPGTSLSPSSLQSRASESVSQGNSIHFSWLLWEAGSLVSTLFSPCQPCLRPLPQQDRLVAPKPGTPRESWPKPACRAPRPQYRAGQGLVGLRSRWTRRHPPSPCALKAPRATGLAPPGAGGSVLPLLVWPVVKPPGSDTAMDKRGARAMTCVCEIHTARSPIRLGADGRSLLIISKPKLKCCPQIKN